MATSHKAILIPHDITREIEEIDLPTGNYKEITKRVCRDGDGLFSVSNLGHFTFAYDDEGLFTQPGNINSRAMAIWAKVEGVSMRSFRSPLVGDYLMLGPADDEGENTDVTPEARRLAEWAQGLANQRNVLKATQDIVEGKDA